MGDPHQPLLAPAHGRSHRRRADDAQEEQRARMERMERAVDTLSVANWAVSSSTRSSIRPMR